MEQLRAAATGDDEGFVVMSASDPANVWSLKLMGVGDTESNALPRPRDPRALLVTRNGAVILTADARMRWVRVHTGTAPEAITAAVTVLVNHITTRRAKDLTIETIDGERAAASEHVKAFMDAGLRLIPAGLRYYASFAR